MSKVVELNENQKKLIKDALDAQNQAMEQAQTAVDLANSKKRALDDLIAMFCASNGLDTAKTKIDMVNWTAKEEE